MTKIEFESAHAWRQKRDELQVVFDKAKEAIEKHEGTCKHWVVDGGSDPATGRSEKWCAFCQKEI